jgi:hypothetical protein
MNDKKYFNNFIKLKNQYHKYQNWWYCENILNLINK